MSSPAGERRDWVERIAEDAPVNVADGDISTTPEAMQVLRGQGVAAWRAWVDRAVNDQPEEGAMADTATIEQPEAPTVEVIEETPGEMKVKFPVLVIENLDTSDGRFLEAGSLTPRALPLSLLAQPESSHGGDEPGPSVLVGRIDTLERVPGSEVISKRTGEPFPEGTFVWRGEGALDPDIQVGSTTIGNLVKRRYLRGISVDLAGMDYDVLGMAMSEDDPGLPLDPENPRRQLVTHSAELAAATLVVVPAFGDAYMELADEDVTPAPIAVEDLPEGMVASATPAWRSPEVGDAVVPVLTAAADEGMPVRIPPDSVEQLAQVIDSGTDRDATELATAIVEHIATTWALDEPVTEEELPTDAVTAAGDEPMDDDAGFPESPQPCQYGPEPAVESLVFREGDAYVPTCAEHKQQAEEELAAAGEVVAEVVPIEADDEEPAVELADEPEELPEVDDDAGMPDAPQPCEFGDHPATMSLLFGSDQYAAVCPEHEQQGRDEITARGDDVTGVVEIEHPAENEETS